MAVYWHLPEKETLHLGPGLGKVNEGMGFGQVFNTALLLINFRHKAGGIMDNRHSFEDMMHLGEDLLKMLEVGSPNDIKIKLSDGEIVANKDILMARNDYFKTMFSNNKFIEGETGSVDMSHCSKAIMEKIIKFLFSGRVTFLDLDFLQLLELSHMSEMMLLSKFKDKLDEYLLDIIRDGGKDVKFLPDLILGAKIADRYNLSSIGSRIMLEILLKLKDIPKDDASSDAFKSLPFKVIRGIILDKFKIDGVLWRRPTKQRFDAFMVWLSNNEDEVTKEDRNEIVDSFDFKDFTVEELITSVRDSGLYSGTEVDKRLLELFKNQEHDLKAKNSVIEEKDLKICNLRRDLADAINHKGIPFHLKDRYRSTLNENKP